MYLKHSATILDQRPESIIKRRVLNKLTNEETEIDVKPVIEFEPGTLSKEDYNLIGEADRKKFTELGILFEDEKASAPIYEEPDTDLIKDSKPKADGKES